MMNTYFFKCHKIKIITFVLCNIFERIWYSESILSDIIIKLNAMNGIFTSEFFIYIFIIVVIYFFKFFSQFDNNRRVYTLSVQVFKWQKKIPAFNSMFQVFEGCIQWRNENSFSIPLRAKVMHPKYSKHCTYTVAHTMNVCAVR